MPQKQYHIKLSDGREFNVTTDGEPPSEEDVLASIPKTDTSTQPVEKTSTPLPSQFQAQEPPKPSSTLDEFRAAALSSNAPLNVAKLLADKAIRSYGLDKIVAEMSNRQSGPLNPNPEQNPLIGKSFLPETQQDPGVVGAVRHTGYEFLRSLASPQGIIGTLFDVAPETSTTASQLMKAGVKGSKLAQVTEKAGLKNPEVEAANVIDSLKSRLETASKPVVDDSGRVIAPNQESLAARPPGPWDANVPDVTSRNPDDILFDIVRKKHQMGLDQPSTSSTGKSKFRYDPRDNTYTNTETGEIISGSSTKTADVASDVSTPPEPDLTPPPSVTPKFTTPGQRGTSGVTSRGEFDPSTLKFTPREYIGGKPQISTGELNPSNVKDPLQLVGETASNSPSQPPRVKLTKGGVAVDRETGEVIRPGSSIPEDISPIDIRRDWTTEILNLPRAIQASYDISFPFRQGLGLIHTKGWWTSWDDMLKSLGSEKAYRATMDSILEKPNYRRTLLPSGKYSESFADQAGLQLTDLVNKREESILSSIAEKIPGIRASNRAYTAFANKLRSDVFDSLIDQADKQGLNPRTNMELARGIASYVNAASGRGSMGALEDSANHLAGLFFSPRMIASRIQMGNQLLNPFTYKMTNSFVKKQYWKSMLGMSSTWLTLASLAKMAGADVNMDPDNTDFAKIKFDNTRLDPMGGFQQYLVLASRLASGSYTSSTSGKETEYGSRYGAQTREDAIKNFIVNKLAPVPAFGASLAGATAKNPVEIGDRLVKGIAPMIIQDISDVIQEDPSLIGAAKATAAGAATGVGMGVQTYGERGQSHRVIPGWSSDYDIKFKGGGLNPFR